MPKMVTNVTRVLIDVNLRAGTFDVQAGTTGGSPSKLPYIGNGGDGAEDVALLRGILAKVGAAYPRGSIGLCLRDPDNDPVIVPDAACKPAPLVAAGAPGGAATVFGVAAPTPNAATPKAPTPKSPAPKATARKSTAHKAAKPKTRGGRKSPKKESG